MDSYGFKNKKVGDLIGQARSSSGDDFQPNAKGNEFFKKYRDTYFDFLGKSINRENQLEQKNFDQEMGQAAKADFDPPSAAPSEAPKAFGTGKMRGFLAERRDRNAGGGGPNTTARFDNYMARAAEGATKDYGGQDIADRAISKAKQSTGAQNRIAGLDYRVGLDQQYYDAKAKSQFADFFGDLYARGSGDFQFDREVPEQESSFDKMLEESRDRNRSRN